MIKDSYSEKDTWELGFSLERRPGPDRFLP